MADASRPATARLYPALEISWSAEPEQDAIDRLLAEVHPFAPTAAEDRARGLRVFFSRTADRDRAREALHLFAPECEISALDVSDDAWAERSQASLGPVQVGRLVIAPPWSPESEPGSAALVVRIQPSMGFGTGHHASTRLCLQLLQDLPMTGRSLLDVGTGSGVLGLAAWRLGAADVLGIDVDPDALASAQENVERNGAGRTVTLRPLDAMTGSAALPRRFDVVSANLTGAMIERTAPALSAWVAANGHVIVSGFQEDEEQAVAGALGVCHLTVTARAQDDGWVALCLGRE